MWPFLFWLLAQRLQRDSDKMVVFVHGKCGRAFPAENKVREIMKLIDRQRDIPNNCNYRLSGAVIIQPAAI